MSSNQPARRFPGAVQRAHNKNLDRIDRLTELAEAKAAGVGRVESRAHFEKMKASLVRREAMRLDPDGADEYRMISLAGTLGMVNVIEKYSRGR